MSQNYNSKLVWRHSLTIALGSLIFGYNAGVFNTSTDPIAAALDWGDDSYTFIIIGQSAMPFGAIFGALSSPNIQRKVGSRKYCMITNVIGITGSILCVMPNTWVFFLGRVISGYTTGAFAAVASPFIRDISPLEISGKTGNLVQFSVLIGLTLSYAGGLALPTNDYEDDPMTYWYIAMFLFLAFVNIIQLLLFMFVYQWESPVWLANNGHDEQALQVFQKYFSDEEAIRVFKIVKGQDELLAQDNGDQKKEQKEEPTYSQLFCDTKYSKMLRLGLLLHFLQQWSGVNGIFSYSTIMFSNLAPDVWFARFCTFLIGVANILSVILLFPLVGKFGRRSLCIFGEFFQGVSLAGVAISILVFEDDVANYLVLVMILSYSLFFELSLGSLAWIYCGECMYGRVISMGVGVNWTSVFLVVLLFQIIVSAVGFEGIFFIFSGISVAGALYLYLDMPESKGKERNEMIDILIGKEEDIATTQRTSSVMPCEEDQLD